MPDVDRDLVALAGVVDLPAERDLVPAVRARLRRRPVRRYVDWRRLAGVVALVVVVAMAATMAVPDARTAVLRFLGIKGATVIRVEELPPAAAQPPAFGESVTLREAERVIGFRPLLIDGRRPDDVRIDRFSPYFIMLLYGEPERPTTTDPDGRRHDREVRPHFAARGARGGGRPAGALGGRPARLLRPVRAARGWRETSFSGSRKV